MNIVLNGIPNSPIQRSRRKCAILYKNDDSNDDRSTYSSAVPKSTIVSQWSMNCFLWNIFEDGEECSKEDTTIDRNSSPFYDKYLDEDCELYMSRQVMENDDETFFIQI